VSSLQKLQWGCGEEGASSALAFIIVLLLSVIALVSYLIVTTESQNSLGHLRLTQASYAAEAGIELGLRKMYDGDIIDQAINLTVGRGTVLIQATKISGNWSLTATAQIANATKTLNALVDYQPRVANFAIYSTDDIDNVTSLDENGNPDPTLAVEYADSLPTIDYQGLVDMAIAQSHVKFDATFTPADGYPNGSFYYSGSTPNVTQVTGNLKVRGGRTVYGIFIVEGDAVLEGSSRTVGILYLQNPGQIVIHGGGDPTASSVYGGIVANGKVDGTGNHITVRYDPDYMELFGQYENRQGSVRVLAWKEL